jgi:hypothetical protein
MITKMPVLMLFLKNEVDLLNIIFEI